MAFRITKECGVWWEASLVPETFAWGVSEKQRSRAEKVEPGDTFLHFIDSARAWAGYSTVMGVMKPNDRDLELDWRVALPFVIPIKRGVWLNKNECSLTDSVDGLVGDNYHRQRAFTVMKSADAEKIMSIIDASRGKESTPSPKFCSKWNKDAEQYYWDIVRGSSGGKCWLCGMSAVAWVEKNGISIPKDEVQKIVEGFLDIAHIEARSESGKMSPDNIRALCPNCHRLVDRIPKKSRKELLLGPKKES